MERRYPRIFSQFCVAVAGFRPRSSLCDAIFLPSFSTPTLHVLGRTDVIVVEERSKTLLDVSDNKRVEYHDGGGCSDLLAHVALAADPMDIPRRTLRSIKSELAQFLPKLSPRPTGCRTVSRTGRGIAAGVWYRNPRCRRDR